MFSQAKSVADPDFQIRGGLKKFFSALWTSVWSQSKGTPSTPGAPPLDLPLLVILGLISLVALFQSPFELGRKF